MNRSPAPQPPPVVRLFLRRHARSGVLTLIAGLVATASLAYGAQRGPHSEASVPTAPIGSTAPPLEPPFTLQDVPAFVPAPSSANRTASQLSSVPSVESDTDHVARLMAVRLRCGATHANDLGGWNADCVTTR
jgi:hypothetical protein